MTTTTGMSGGRTSTYMTELVRSQHDPDAVPIMCDTGGEHPGTYEFVRKSESHFKWPLVCLKGVVKVGRGTNDFKVVPSSELKWDLSLTRAIVKKYGGFTVKRAHCTDKMKTLISNKFRKAIGGTEHWIGIRIDEPNRLVGKKLYEAMRKKRLSDEDIAEMFLTSRAHPSKTLPMFNAELKEHNLKLKKRSVRYLAEISDYEKQDVVNWFRDKPFDLEIPEWWGNCVFCVKKSDLKVVLAARQNPELFKDWCDATTGDHVRLMPADKHGKGKIYRRWLSPQQLIATFEDVSTKDLLQRVRGTKADKNMSCSESCEPMGELWE